MKTKDLAIFNFVIFMSLGILCACGQTGVIPNQTKLPIEISSPTIAATLDPDLITSEMEVRDGKYKGGMILMALDKYFQENNHYPHSLNELTPEYLDDLPIPISGHDFKYLLIDDERSLLDPYILSFVVTKARDKKCVYHPRFEGWECGPSQVP